MDVVVVDVCFLVNGCGIVDDDDDDDDVVNVDFVESEDGLRKALLGVME